MRDTICKQYEGTISVAWSWVNQSYFVMWHDAVLRTITDRNEAIAYLKDLGVLPR